MSGIEVKAKFVRPSTGILFVRDHSQNCSAKFNETMMAVCLPYFWLISNIIFVDSFIANSLTFKFINWMPSNGIGSNALVIYYCFAGK